jgi:hypothetical protein
MEFENQKDVDQGSFRVTSCDGSEYVLEFTPDTLTGCRSPRSLAFGFGVFPE